MLTKTPYNELKEQLICITTSLHANKPEFADGQRVPREVNAGGKMGKSLIDELRSLKKNLEEIAPAKSNNSSSKDFDTNLSKSIFALPELMDEQTLASANPEFVDPKESVYPAKAYEAILNIVDRSIYLLNNPSSIPWELGSSTIRTKFNFLDETWVPKIVDETTYKTGLALQPFLDYLLKEKPTIALFTPRYDGVAKMKNILDQRLLRYKTMQPQTVIETDKLIQAKIDARAEIAEKTKPLFSEADKILDKEQALVAFLNQPLDGDTEKISDKIIELSKDKEALSAIETELRLMLANWIAKQVNLPHFVQVIPFTRNETKSIDEWLGLLQPDNPQFKEHSKAISLTSEGILSALEETFQHNMEKVRTFKKTRETLSQHSEALQEKLHFEQLFADYKETLSEIGTISSIELPAQLKDEQTELSLLLPTHPSLDDLKTAQQDIMNYKNQLTRLSDEIRQTIPLIPKIPQLSESKSINYEPQFAQLRDDHEKRLVDEFTSVQNRVEQLNDPLKWIQQKIESETLLQKLSVQMQQISTPSGTVKQSNGDLTFDFAKSTASQLEKLEKEIPLYQKKLENQLGNINEAISTVSKWDDTNDSFRVLKEETLKKLATQKEVVTASIQALVTLQKEYQNTTSEGRNNALNTLTDAIRLNFAALNDSLPRLNQARVRLNDLEQQIIERKSKDNAQLTHLSNNMATASENLRQPAFDYNKQLKLIEERTSALNSKAKNLQIIKTVLKSNTLSKEEILALQVWSKEEEQLIIQTLEKQTGVIQRLRNLVTVATTDNPQQILARLIDEKQELIRKELEQKSDDITAFGEEKDNLLALNKELNRLEPIYIEEKSKWEQARQQFIALDQKIEQRNSKLEDIVKPFRDEVTRAEKQVALLEMTDAHLRLQEFEQKLTFKIHDMEQLLSRMEDDMKEHADESAAQRLEAINADGETQLLKWKDDLPAELETQKKLRDNLSSKIQRLESFPDKANLTNTVTEKTREISEKLAAIDKRILSIIDAKTKLQEFEVHFEEKLDCLLAVASNPRVFNEKFKDFTQFYQAKGIEFNPNEKTEKKMKILDTILAVFKPQQATTNIGLESDSRTKREWKVGQHLKSENLLHKYFGQQSEKIAGVFGKYMDDRAKKYWVSDFLQTLAAISLFFFYKPQEDKRWDYLQNELRPALNDFTTNPTAENSHKLNQIISKGLTDFSPRSDSSTESLHAKLMGLQAEVTLQTGLIKQDDEELVGDDSYQMYD